MKKRILIVDDTEGWLIFHAKTIKELFGESYEIVTAPCAKDALSLIYENHKNPFEIILTDLQMETNFAPKTAGEWLVENIKSQKEYSNSKIIIISAMYNIRQIAKNYEVECIPKSSLINNKLLLKLMFEKIGKDA